MLDYYRLNAWLMLFSWLVWPYLAWLSWRLYKVACNGWKRRVDQFLVLGCLVFTWARFIEPHWIITHERSIPFPQHLEIALISDLHLGLYKDSAFLQRVVNELNRLPVQAVVITGDFIYLPDQPLEQLLAPLRQLRHPSYAVLGNHDLGLPGTDHSADLRQVLPRLGVRLIEGQSITLNGVTLTGLAEHWSGQDDPRPLYASAQPRLLLVHNPDTLRRLNPASADVILAGHTHCGQIRIPWLYKKVLPVNGPYDCNLVHYPQGWLFISPGLGEIGLPMRLFNPPRIDWLHLAP